MIKRKGLPTIGESVLCTVQRISPYAAWCVLDEYENLEGMVHISEVAGKWVHDIREFVKPNKQYVTKVVRIDKEKGIINLSIKRVSANEGKQKLNAFRKEQRAEKILEQAGQALGRNPEQAFAEVGSLLREKFGELFVAMEEIKADKSVLEKYGVEKKWIDALSTVVEKAMKEKEIILKAEIELRSYSSNGISEIKKILGELQSGRTSVKYISAPKYRIELKTKDPKRDEKKLRENMDAAVKAIQQTRGEGSYTFVK